MTRAGESFALKARVCGVNDDKICEKKEIEPPALAAQTKKNSHSCSSSIAARPSFWSASGSSLARFSRDLPQHQNLLLRGSHNQGVSSRLAIFMGMQLHSEKCLVSPAFMMRAEVGLEATPRSCKLATCLTAAMKNLK